MAAPAAPVAAPLPPAGPDADAVNPVSPVPAAADTSAQPTAAIAAPVAPATVPAPQSVVAAAPIVAVASEQPVVAPPVPIAPVVPETPAVQASEVMPAALAAAPIGAPPVALPSDVAELAMQAQDASRLSISDITRNMPSEPAKTEEAVIDPLADVPLLTGTAPVTAAQVPVGAPAIQAAEVTQPLATPVPAPDATVLPEPVPSEQAAGIAAIEATPVVAQPSAATVPGESVMVTPDPIIPEEPETDTQAEAMIHFVDPKMESVLKADEPEVVASATPEADGMPLTDPSITFVGNPASAESNASSIAATAADILPPALPPVPAIEAPAEVAALPVSTSEVSNIPITPVIAESLSAAADDNVAQPVPALDASVGAETVPAASEALVDNLSTVSDQPSMVSQPVALETVAAQTDESVIIKAEEQIDDLLATSLIPSGERRDVLPPMEDEAAPVAPAPAVESPKQLDDGRHWVGSATPAPVMTDDENSSENILLDGGTPSSPPSPQDAVAVTHSDHKIIEPLEPTVSMQDELAQTSPQPEMVETSVPIEPAPAVDAIPSEPMTVSVEPVIAPETASDAVAVTPEVPLTIEPPLSETDAGDADGAVETYDELPVAESLAVPAEPQPDTNEVLSTDDIAAVTPDVEAVETPAEPLPTITEAVVPGSETEATGTETNTPVTEDTTGSEAPAATPDDNEANDGQDDNGDAIEAPNAPQEPLPGGLILPTQAVEQPTTEATVVESERPTNLAKGEIYVGRQRYRDCRRVKPESVISLTSIKDTGLSRYFCERILDPNDDVLRGARDLLCRPLPDHRRATRKSVRSRTTGTRNVGQQ